MSLTVDNCCCCVSLRSATVGYGIFSLAFYIAVVTGGAFHLISLSDERQEYCTQGKKTALKFVKDLHGQHRLWTIVYVIIILTVFQILFSCLTIVSAVLLLIGTIVESHILLLPWIISVLLTNVFNLFYTIQTAPIFENLAFDLAFLVFYFYGSLCAFSRFKKLSAAEANPSE